MIASTESGSYQLHAWDRRTGRRRQVTTDPVGVLEGRPTRDGTGVVWFRDETGDETGTFVIAPFDEDVAPEPLLPGLPKGWPDGLAIGRRRTVAAISTGTQFTVWVSDDGADVRLLHTHAEPVRLAAGSGMSGAVDRAALSADDAVVVLEVMDDGDVLHPSLRSVDTVTGETIAELRDPGLELAGFGFSPVPGDLRMAITHERIGERRPALWHARTGELTDLQVDLPGAVEPVGWWPDGEALLLLVLQAGRHELYRYDVSTASTTRLETVARLHHRRRGAPRRKRLVPRPQRHASGPAARGRLGRAAPRGGWACRAGRAPVRGLVVREPAWPARPWLPGPPGRRRAAPVMMRVHGGPHSVDMDRWAPDVLAHVDAGFLVAMVNYRGSEGFGQAWRDALTGNIGFLELEDVLAGLDDIVARGLGDPARVVLAGWSWGGYVTLLGAGRHPERWASLIAGVPVADYIAAYEDEAPMLQALDRALFGGSPAEVPALYAERNPLTYVDAVEAPLLILAGENDSRCPIRQVWNYVGRLQGRGVVPRVYTYGTGHASFDIEERVRQTAIVLDHLAATVPGVHRLENLDAHLAAAGR